MVTPQNPFKESKSLLNARHRKHLVDLALEDDARMKSTDIEFHLPKPSYTIDTLTYLKEKYPEHEFVIIMGSDGFQNIRKWKNGEVILRDYEITIYPREGFMVNASQLNERIQLIDAPVLQISGSYIRRLVKERKSIRYLVPDVVMEEIENQQFYF